MLHQSGLPFSYPILNLEEGTKLLLSFDDLSDEFTDYSYTLIHCTADWKESGLNPLEYLAGFEENELRDFENSFNTLIPYRHFELSLPNADVQPKISGNYVLFVYENQDRSQPVLTRRFYVAEEKLQVVEASVKRPSRVSFMDKYQELSFKIYDKERRVVNPLEDLQVSVYQNNDPNFSITELKPAYIKDNLFEYTDPEKLCFPGGNEFRYFNSKDTKYLNHNVYAIYFKSPYYFFELLPDSGRCYKSYTYMQDLDGQFWIEAQSVQNPSLESEYVFTDFTLYQDFTESNSNFYVYGALSNYRLDKKYKMTYDYNRKAYTLRLLLKQGIYNYAYVFADPEKKNVDFSVVEGSYAETENYYLILCYYHAPGTQYDRIIGYKIINTIKE